MKYTKLTETTGVLKRDHSNEPWDRDNWNKICNDLRDIDKLVFKDKDFIASHYYVTFHTD